MKLHDLHPPAGSHKPPRRVGRGHGSGRGKTAGRGTKGQKSRAGGGIPAWFEGGQTPLHVRTPKLHGFKNRFRVEYAGVNLGRLSEAASGTLITPDVLVHDGLLRQSKTKARPVKILGGGDAPKGVTIHAHAFTRSALEKLAAAGSTAQRISWPDNLPVDEAGDEAAAEGTAAAEDTPAADTEAEETAAPEETDAADMTADASDAQAEATAAEAPKRRSRAKARATDESDEATGGESEPPA